MDVATLARLAREALEYTQQVGVMRIAMRMPTAHELRMAYLRHAEESDAATGAAVTRALLEAGVVGWAGVTAADLAPGEADAEVPWEPAAVPLLLDGRPGVADALVVELMQRLADRRSRREAAAGN